MTAVAALPCAPTAARTTDQATGLRALVAAARSGSATARRTLTPVSSPRSTPVIAITSGKGGVGKTSLSVNLCIAMVRDGYRSTLVDADLGMANADVMCGLLPLRRIDQTLGGDSRFDLSDIAIQAPGGFLLVPGSVGIAHTGDLSSTDRQAVLDGLTALEDRTDIVIVDTGAGVGPGVVDFVAAADHAVIVATPEPTSIADAYAMIKVVAPRRVGASPGSLWILLNEVVDGQEAARVHGRIAGVAQRFLGFAPPMLGWVPLDRAIPEAVRARRPLLLTSPKSPAARSIGAIAERMCAEAGAQRQASVAPPARSLLGRLLRL